MKNIAIFASGTGTNAENIAEYFSKNEKINVALIVSNRLKAGVHERAARLHIPSITLSKADFEAGDPVLKVLQEYHIDFIVLAGFMSKISDPLIQAFPEKIVNIHPSLLPKYGGKGMYGIQACMVSMYTRLSLRPEKKNQALRYIILMSITMKVLSSSKLPASYCRQTRLKM